MKYNEAPRSKLRGISGAELRRSRTRLPSHELRRGRLAIPLCSKLQSILAKANEIADSREGIMSNTDIRTVQQNMVMGVMGNN